MVNFFDSFQRGFAQARADTARPAAKRDPCLSGEAEKANGAVAPAAEQKAFAEVTALAEQLTARVEELEGQVGLLAEVLRLPGVKTYLVGRFHADKHPNANESEREALTARLQKVNAAYEIAERSDNR